MTARTATPPSLIGQPDIGLFRKDDFSAAIWAKGYDVTLEQSISCPCKGISGAPKTDCQNCLGYGIVFINPLRTKVLVSSINRETKYQHWSPELIGTISVTARDEERFSVMDRITFNTRTSILSEVRKMRYTSTLLPFIFCSYKVTTIKNIFVFSTSSAKLIRLSSNDYTVNPDNKICVNFDENIDLPEGFNGVVSIEYEHEVTYNVVDLPHDFRSTFLTNERGQNVEYNMPVQAIARRSHIVFGEPSNYTGDNLLNNNTV